MFMMSLYHNLCVISYFVAALNNLCFTFYYHRAIGMAFKKKLAIKLKMINQDHMIFGDFSVNFEPISLKFCRGHFLLKSQQG